MKRPDITVTVEHNNRQAKLIGYDRDRYYIVQYLDDSTFDRLKYYHMQGMEQLKSNHRFLLNPGADRVSNKELSKDYKANTRGNIVSTKKHTFGIYMFNGDKSTELSWNELTFGQLKTKLRRCVQQNLNCHVSITTYYKGGCSYGSLMEYEDNVYTFFKNRNRAEQINKGTFERGIIKLMDSF